MKINFQALGCRLNEAELESWSNEIVQKGHELTATSQDADVVVFNTCSVTSEADRKSRKQINRIHKQNPETQLVVTGCYASLQTEAVRNQLGVDLVISNQHKDRLVETILKPYDTLKPEKGNWEKQSLFKRGRHRAFIKVQDGCRYRCTFCIVTLARGEERSRVQQQILDEIRQYHQQGVQEIVITGVHVGGYGSDNGSNLYELLSEILAKTDIPRVRLASVEPWDLPDNFFDLFKDNRLMPHMHLPLQSGSDSVLRRMARRCKTAEFETIVDKARSSVSHFNVTTDLIVGFPGETQQEWEQTVNFVQRTGFGHMHIFPYSRREGTRAANLPDQIDRTLKKERSQQMHALAQQLKQNEMKKLVGKTCDVLWENSENSTLGEWTGYTPHYHKIKAIRPANSRSEIAEVGIEALSSNKKYLRGDETSRSASCCSFNVQVS